MHTALLFILLWDCIVQWLEWLSNAFICIPVHWFQYKHIPMHFDAIVLRFSLWTCPTSAIIKSKERKRETHTHKYTQLVRVFSHRNTICSIQLNHGVLHICIFASIHCAFIEVALSSYLRSNIAGSMIVCIRFCCCCFFRSTSPRTYFLFGLLFVLLHFPSYVIMQLFKCNNNKNWFST